MAIGAETVTDPLFKETFSEQPGTDMFKGVKFLEPKKDEEEDDEAGAVKVEKSAPIAPRSLNRSDNRNTPSRIRKPMRTKRSFKRLPQKVKKHIVCRIKAEWLRVRRIRRFFSKVKNAKAAKRALEEKKRAENAMYKVKSAEEGAKEAVEKDRDTKKAVRKANAAERRARTELPSFEMRKAKYSQRGAGNAKRGRRGHVGGRRKLRERK